MNARTAEIAGILKLKLYHMENIDMFRHPKYYKELRKRNKETQPELKSSVSNSDQVISETKPTGDGERAPGPGLKHQASSTKLQAPSTKRQAFEPTLSLIHI